MTYPFIFDNIKSWGKGKQPEQHRKGDTMRNYHKKRNRFVILSTIDKHESILDTLTIKEFLLLFKLPNQSVDKINNIPPFYYNTQLGGCYVKALVIDLTEE